eukprot:TRINITY_DN10301_c0_g2_i2.p1 TRINITY_DN10301_c0_g2~~TRINITY_DN10301_c0_g2_i2.p1  ORF type:complete len:172 (+),score=47.47 TRINITY_DN10301_c0_g2_i2:175-690(+)
MWQYLDVYEDWDQGTVINTFKALAPYNLRVGGITADFVKYTMATPCPSTSGGDGPWDWPTYERNITICALKSLLHVVKESNASLLFDLNELHGRNCHYNNTRTCVGDWDSSNVKNFLQFVKANDTLKDVSFLGWELGNELTRSGHITIDENIKDILQLAELVQVCLFVEIP